VWIARGGLSSGCNDKDFGVSSSRKSCLRRWKDRKPVASGKIKALTVREFARLNPGGTPQ
jgi:hypothetical protein